MDKHLYNILANARYDILRYRKLNKVQFNINSIYDNLNKLSSYRYVYSYLFTNFNKATKQYNELVRHYYSFTYNDKELKDWEKDHMFQHLSEKALDKYEYNLAEILYNAIDIYCLPRRRA